MFAISLTGHRPNALWGYDLSNPHYKSLFNELSKIINQALKEHTVITCRSGMALGADTVWAYAIIHAKEKYPDRVRFVADIPFTNQSGKWRKSDKKRYKELLTHVDESHVYSSTYTSNCMMDRNMGLVDNANVLIAVYNNSNFGGTANTVKYAQSKNYCYKPKFNRIEV